MSHAHPGSSKLNQHRVSSEGSDLYTYSGFRTWRHDSLSQVLGGSKSRHGLPCPAELWVLLISNKLDFWQVLADLIATEPGFQGRYGCNRLEPGTCVREIDSTCSSTEEDNFEGSLRAQRLLPHLIVVRKGAKCLIGTRRSVARLLYVRRRLGSFSCATLVSRHDLTVVVCT
jgi:hypothetical protein